VYISPLNKSAALR